MYACSADSLTTPARRSHEGAASTGDPTLNRAPGTHHCLVYRGSVDSKLAHGFAHTTGDAEIEPQTPGSLVQHLNRSAIRSTETLVT